MKGELHEDQVQPLPLTPLTPRTEQELRRSCRTLLSVPLSPRAATPTGKYQHLPLNAACSFNQTTANADRFNSSSTQSKDKLDLVRHLYEKPHPPPPHLTEPHSPLSPNYTFTPAIAKKFSICELRADSFGTPQSLSDPSASPISVLRRRPTLIDVSPGHRPRTADMRTRRVLERINQAGGGEKEKLGLFPARPSTSHHERCGPFIIDLIERPLPPLPATLKPVQRSKSDSEVILGKAQKESKGLRGLRKHISLWFGRKKNESAAVAA